MPPPYLIFAPISRQDALALMKDLATDENFRKAFEERTSEVLREHGIIVGEGTLPERVTLPSPEAIKEFIVLLEQKGLASETASPFGLALMILAFGAMPVQIGDRSALDGTG